jgi:DNA-binding SARP family transcriptional activator/tetratricopeptide (TPR) repeat protein
VAQLPDGEATAVQKGSDGLTSRDDDEGRLRIRLIGAFAVERDGREVPPAECGTKKARTVLKVLAAHRGRMVPMDKLVAVLWAARPPADAAANVATLVSRLRAAFGAEIIDGGRAGYRLATGPGVGIDLDEAAGLVAEAEARLASGQAALAVVAADAALACLGTGSVLEDEPEADWGGEAGREAERVLRRAREAAWQAASAVGDHRRALTAAADAVTADPLDEQAHRAVMRAYHRLGEPGEALASYERLRAGLAEELGADPAPATERTHLAVLRGSAMEEETAWSRPPADDDEASTGNVAGRAGESGLVGREQELAALVGHWAGAVRGSTTCLLVIGEAGIGKTRLAAELARQAEATGALVLTARCFEAERSLFLQPVLEVTRAAAARVHPDRLREAAGDWAGPLGALLPELNRLLRPIGYQPAAAELERRRAFEALTALLAALARQRPLLVVLDDLHLAGASTLEWLHFLLRWEPAAPLLVLATLRSGEADDAIGQLGPLAAIVELGPLSETAVAELASAMGLQARVAEVLALTRGHTLFVVEALRTLAEGGAEQVLLPPSLQAAVSARARRCGPEVEDVLRVAAVAGMSLELDEVAALTDLTTDEVARRAEQACRARLLMEAAGRYEFANELIRSALYETTPAPTRVVRHQRLAARAAARPEVAAAHAAAAGDWELAVTSWVEAARQASAAFANWEAEALLTRALDVSALIDTPALVALAQFDRGRARVALGRYADATTDLAAAQQLARATGDVDLEAAAVEQLGWAAYHARDARAVALAERAAAHPAARPGARVLWGRVRNLIGDLPSAIDALEPIATSAADVEPAVAATASSYLATALCHADRFGEAARVAEETIETCRRSGALRAMLNARMFGAMARANLGDFGVALDQAERLREEAERFDAPFYRPRALNILAWIWRELGQPQLARDLATEALEISAMGRGRDAEREPAANALLALAESALLGGDAAGATSLLGDIAPLVARGVSYGWRIELRQLELLARLDPARGEELRALARQRGSAKYESLALAHLGQHGEAVTVAARTGSDWLLAAVAPPPRAGQAIERAASRLPERLRADFLVRGAVASRRR